MASLLERLDNESPSELKRRSTESLKWFRQRIRRIKTNSEQFYKKSDLEKTRRFLEGRMFTYFYDPKYKELLPYYDTFPCVIIVETYASGLSLIHI